MAFFGIRGVGPLYCLSYSLYYELFEAADEAFTTVVFTVIRSVAVHGICAPSAVAKLYEAEKEDRVKTLTEGAHGTISIRVLSLPPFGRRRCRPHTQRMKTGFGLGQFGAALKARASLAAIIAVVMAAGITVLDLKNWRERDRVIEHDVHSYYAYLPAFFIYDDITLEAGDYNPEEKYYYFWPNYTPEGRKVIKMSMGLSVLYAPFFFAAHAYATLSDVYPASGFSEPYKVMLLVSALCYLLLGLLAVRRILRAVGFSEGVTAFTVLLIGAGTNLFAYASQSAPNVHVYNFFLFAAFLLLTRDWYRSPGLRRSAAVGLLFGLIALVRPSNAVIALFFVLYGTGSLRDIAARIRFFAGRPHLLIMIAACAAAVWVPQLFYWKAATGSWLYYSYNEEGFYFTDPKIVEGLFSFRKGWLVYTPMMVFALIGFFVMRGAARAWRLPVAVFAAVNIYVVFSWWCWWYGGTFGQRVMIESYALLAVPFASFLAFLSGKSAGVKWAFGAVAGFFIWLNIFQTYQFENLSLHHDGMNRTLWLKQFGRMEKVPDFDSLVDWPDYEGAKEREE